MTFDPERLRAQFPIFAARPGGQPLHYLDNAATAQLPQAVLDAVIAYETGIRANVRRGVHRLAEAATRGYEEARSRVASYLHATPDEVVFTAGTTASINLLAYSLEPTLRAGDEIVLSLAEHHSNLVPWQMLAARRGLTLRWLPVADDGRIDLSPLTSVVTARCRLLAIAQCSNVTGAVTDLAPIASAARAVGARLMIDGAQGAPAGPLDPRALGADFYAFSGHKCFAPNGIGVLWGRRERLADLEPAFGGGGMVGSVSVDAATYARPPHRFEAGTPPIGQAIGLGAALDWIVGIDPAAARAHVGRLTGRMLDALQRLNAVKIVGPATVDRRIGVVSFVVAGVHPHDVAQMLDGRGVAVRAGHHCAQPLMTRFGIEATVRASLAPYNTVADVNALIDGVADAAQKLA